MLSNRREFLKVSAGVCSAAATGSFIGGCQKGMKSRNENKSGGAVFNYAMCNESMMDLAWSEQCAIVANAGYKGIEIASFTLVERGVGEITAGKRKEMVKVMSDNGLRCAGLHWLLAPPPKGLHFTSPDKAVRQRTVFYLDELIDFCGDLGGEAMIFGSPKQRNTMGISKAEAMKYFAEGMTAVADHAKRRGVMIMIEPLDHTQTDVVNTTDEAMEIVKEVDHPSIQTMFDFHNTVDEIEDFVTLLKKYRKWIHQVHVMEMDGSYLGTGNAVDKYVDAFQYLKDIGYDKWVSLEVFDFKPGGKTIADESMKVLKQIEAKLS